MKKNKLYYSNGNEIKIGDVVQYGDSPSKIVFVINTNSYSKEYPQKEWSYLKEGFGIETENFGLIHQIEPDEDIQLIKRESINIRERITKIELKAREKLSRQNPEPPDETA